MYVSLSVAPTRLKELLNIVYYKGQYWDMCISAYTIIFCKMSYARG